MKETSAIKRVFQASLRGAIRAYQIAISPLTPPCCRFYPSCSSYALEAIEKFGALRGLYLSVMRLGRCHPLCQGGVDFVPESFSWRPWAERRHEVHEETETAVST